MFKVKFKDLSGQIKYQGIFDSQLQAENWRDKHIGSYGRRTEAFEVSGSAIPKDLTIEDATSFRTETDESGIEITYYTFPADATVTITDITTQVEAEEARKGLKERGKKARQLCEDILDLIAGRNLEVSLTASQIDQLQSTFVDIDTALRAHRPFTAKTLIQALTPDGTLVTQELKDQVLAVYDEYGQI